MRVGVVGLGIMGAPMARNLLRAGHTVAVYNQTPARAEPLVALGARAVASPAAVAAASDVVVTCVSDGPDVEQVVCGPDGVLEGGASGLLVIDMSTIAPAIARSVAARCAERGLAFLDAPVSGGEQGAVDGTLSIMVGGDAAAFERAAPVFAVLGKRATHMGASGQGQMTKLVNQVVGAVTLAAVAEGVTLAARAGLEPGAVIEAVGSGAATSWMVTNLGPKMQRHDLAPGFMVRLQQKDLRLALGAAAAVGAALPTTAVVHQLFAAVEARGDGALGTQALVTILEALAGVERS